MTNPIDDSKTNQIIDEFEASIEMIDDFQSDIEVIDDFEQNDKIPDNTEIKAFAFFNNYDDRVIENPSATCEIQDDFLEGIQDSNTLSNKPSETEKRAENYSGNLENLQITDDFIPGYSNNDE